jgi:glycosyltransferase involved in cell wall biosynthesis
MNICMISYSVYESDGRVMRYAETLAKRGDRVDVIALSRAERTSDDVIAGVNVFRVQGRTHDEKGPLTYLVRLLSFFVRAMLFMLRRQPRGKYDVVHVHSVPDFMVFTAWLPKLQGAKIILDIHDVLPELYASKFGVSETSLIYKLLLKVEKSSAAFADHVIIANDIWRGKLLARSVPADKCTAILNFPDRSIFARQGRSRADESFVMLYPGTLNWHQGLDIAIRAFAAIKDAAPNAEFHIYGVGPAEDSLRSLAASLGLNGRVKLNGTREIRDVASLMENADLGVVPKRNDPFGDEAFSTKTLEFMAMGVPVLVADTKIDRYYFTDSIVQFFRAGDEASLSESMLGLIRNSDRRGDLVRNASKFIDSNDWESNKSRYLDIVDGLTAHVRPRCFPSVYSFGHSPVGPSNKTSDALSQYYRCPEFYSRLSLKGELSEERGFFRWGEHIVYGRCSGQGPANSPTGPLYDALQDTSAKSGTTCLPFDPTEVIDSLRYERYSQSGNSQVDSAIAKLYYLVRPLMPIEVRKHLQRVRLNGWRDIPFPKWPVDRTADQVAEQLLLLALRAQGVDRIPFIWFWPDGAASCAVMTHDVETTAGRDFCSTLMDIDDSFGIKASFQVVPERRYDVPSSYLDSIRNRGFEINVQDLNHDGHLFRDRTEFLSRVEKINSYGREFGAAGFRSAILYRRQEWYDSLQFSYDMSVPNVAHLDPQRGGCCTIMPYYVGGILELPVTMTQDYSIFHILDDHSIALWKQQSELIMQKHGFMSFIIHPDYITKDRERKTYETLLSYLSQLRSERKVWIPLPREVDQWWRQRTQMKLVRHGNEWHIEGPGHERAQLAYASEKNGQIDYTIDSSQQASSLVKSEKELLRPS